jgi:hypothetical protein
MRSLCFAVVDIDELLPTLYTMKFVTSTAQSLSSLVQFGEYKQARWMLSDRCLRAE